MPYYLSSYLGAGTTTDPFRPHGSDQHGWSAIDLRPDGGVTLGGGGLNACLLHLPVADPNPVLRLLALDPADTIGPLVRRMLATRLHVPSPLRNRRWDDIAAELLLTPPPGAGNALRPTRSGQYEIWLGGLLKRFPAIRGGVSISENWNCADSASLTCQLTWTKFNGTAWEIFSNLARRNGNSGWNHARADSDLATSNHEVQATFIDFIPGAGGTIAIGVIARKDSTATLTFYGWWPVNNNTHRLTKWVGGVETFLQVTTDIFVANEIGKLQCNGSTIKGFLNGVEKASVTDTDISGNLRCGIAGYGDSVGSSVTLDNWSAADLGAAATAPPRFLGLLGVGT